MNNVIPQRVWMVTGTSRGFGAEIARGVLASGDKLIATARNLDSLQALGEDDNLLAAAVDVTSETQVMKAMDAALARFGRIDVLVNNAAYGLLGAIEESSATEIENIFSTNVFGLLNVTRAILPIMRKQRSGHIMNMSSVGGFSARPGWGVYSATKFAVEAISESLHGELAPLGIHVTVIEPGSFRTDFLDNSSLISTATTLPDYAATVGKMRDFVVERNHQQPGDPKKLAQALLQLAHLPDPPLRLPLGTDTLRRICEKNAFVETETAKWKTLSESTDFD